MKLLKINSLSIITLLFLFSCAKKEKPYEQPVVINTELSDGFPENIKAINGYLYSGVQTYQYSSSSMYFYTFAYAAFSDPARNLLVPYNHYSNNKNFSNNNVGIGNIDVGIISLNGNTVNKNIQSNFEVYYGQNFNNNVSFLNLNANWLSEGNKTFKPLNIIINKGHPIIAVNSFSISTTISKNTNFTVNIGNNVTNYDSLIVILEDGNFNSRIRKVLPKNALSVTFTTQEMSLLSNTSNGKLGIYAFNYSNKTVDSKVNLFELSNQYIISNIYIN